MILLLLSFNLFKCSVALNQPVRITASYNGNLYLADFPGIGLRLVQGHADNDIANIRMGKNGTELWFGDRQICSDSGNKLNVCDGSAGASSGWYFEGEMSGFYYIKHNNQCLRVGSKAYDTAYDAYEVVLDDCTENNCREKFRIVEVERDNMVRDGQDKYVHCIMNQVETANTVTPMISSNVVPVPVGISEGMAVVATNNANVSSGIKQKVEESDINLNIRIDGGKSDTSDNSIVVGEPGIIQQPVVYSTAQTQPVVYTQEVQIPSPTTQQVLVHPQTAVLTAVPEPQPVQQIVVQQEEAYTPTAVVISTAIPPNIPIQVVDAQEVPPSPAVVVQEIREHKPAPKMVVKREAQPQKLVIKGSAGSSLDSSAGKGYAISGSRNGQYIQSTGAGSQQGAARVVKAVEVEKEQPVIVQKSVPKVSAQPVVVKQVRQNVVPKVVEAKKVEPKVYKKVVKVEQQPKEKIVVKPSPQVVYKQQPVKRSVSFAPPAVAVARGSAVSSGSTGSMGSAGSAGIISSPGKYIKVEQPKVVAGVLAQQETAPVAKVVSGVSSQQEPIPVAKVEPVARPAAKAVAVAVQPQHRAATVAISSSPKAAPANIQFVDVSQPEPPKTVKIAPAPVKKQPVYNIKPAKEVVEVPVAPVQENYVPAPTQEYIEVQSEMPYIAKEAKQVVQAAEPQYVMETEGAQPQEYELITDGSRQETGSAAVEYYTNQEVPQEAQAVYVSGDTSQGGYISVDSQDEQGVAYIEQQPTEYIEHQSAEYMPVEEEIEPVATQYVEARPKPVLVPVEEPKQVLVEEPKVLKTSYDTKKDENSDEICLMCNGNSSVSPALMANPSKEGCGCSPDE